MKKPLLTILLLFFMLTHAYAFNQLAVCAGVPAVAAGGCDDCSGTLVFSTHFENDNDITVGTPCGCSDGTTAQALTGGSTYSSTYASDGTYSCKAEGENDVAAIDTTVGGGIDVVETGTYCADAYFTGTAEARTFTIAATVYGRIIYDAGGSTLRINYSTEDFRGTDTFSNSTWTRVCFSWDASQAGGADKLGVRVGTNAWEEKTTTISPPANPGTYYIVSGSWQYGRGYYDNIKIYSDYKHNE